MTFSGLISRWAIPSEFGDNEAPSRVFAYVVNSEDVGVVQRGGGARLLLEAAQMRGLQGARRERLQCDPAAQARIFGQVNPPHAA
jgi:hypothetical protein